MRRALLAVLICGTAGLALSACGSEQTPVSTTDTATRTTDDVETAAYVARAEAICRQGLRETRILGQRLQEASKKDGTLAATTSALVRPGTRIRLEMADRLRRLKLPPQPELFVAYIGLFDPIDALARERIKAGDAGDRSKSRELERLAVQLADEQKQAALAAGLPACAKDFIAEAFSRSTK